MPAFIRPIASMPRQGNRTLALQLPRFDRHDGRCWCCGYFSYIFFSLKILIHYHSAAEYATATDAECADTMALLQVRHQAQVSAYKFPAKSVHTTTSIPQSGRNNCIHSAARAVLVSG